METIVTIPEPSSGSNEAEEPTPAPAEARTRPGLAANPELAQQIAAGDEGAFKRVFDAYLNPLCWYAYGFVKSRETARDVVHDVFLTLWHHRARLASVRNLEAYLYTMVRRDALDHLKHENVEARWRARHEGPAAIAEDHIAPGGTDQRAVGHEIESAVLRAIAALPRRQREVLTRRWNQESSEEIAAALGIALKTVETHFHRAVERLRVNLAHHLK